MNKDLHSPAFIRASVPADKEEPLQVASKTTPSNDIKWSRIIRFTLLMGILSGGVYLLSKLVTAQVVTALLILIGFVVLRFIVRTVLQITFTLLRYLFWIVVLAVILLCVLWRSTRFLSHNTLWVIGSLRSRSPFLFLCFGRGAFASLFIVPPYAEPRRMLFLFHRKGSTGLNDFLKVRPFGLSGKSPPLCCSLRVVFSAKTLRYWIIYWISTQNNS